MTCSISGLNRSSLLFLERECEWSIDLEYPMGEATRSALAFSALFQDHPDSDTLNVNGSEASQPSSDGWRIRLVSKGLQASAGEPILSRERLQRAKALMRCNVR